MRKIFFNALGGRGVLNFRRKNIFFYFFLEGGEEVRIIEINPRFFGWRREFRQSSFEKNKHFFYIFSPINYYVQRKIVYSIGRFPKFTDVSNGYLFVLGPNGRALKIKNVFAKFYLSSSQFFLILIEKEYTIVVDMILFRLS